MEIVQERLSREYDLDLIVTAPSVVYKVVKGEGDKAKVAKRDSDTECACGDTSPSCKTLCAEEYKVAKEEIEFTGSVNSATDKAFYYRCPVYKGKKLGKGTDKQVIKTWTMISKASLEAIGAIS